MTRRAVSRERQRRLSDFQDWLAKINQSLYSAGDEMALLSALCEFGVSHGHLDLVWIGQPDGKGNFRFLASAGATGYLDGIRISADPDTPEGQGASGITWRNSVPCFNQSIEKTSFLSPWRERAEFFGLKASASVPVLRNGQVYGVLSVYHRESGIFDEDLRCLLDELSGSITSGLSRIDGRRREENLSSIQKVILDNALAGIALVRERRLIQVNPRFLEMFGYTTRELLGKPTSLFFPDEILYGPSHEPTNRRLPALHLKRKDGRPFLCDILTSPVPGQDGTPLVITLYDVTEFQTMKGKLEQAKDYQRALFESNAAGIFIVDKTRIIRDVNPAFCRLIGYSREELIGQSGLLFCEHKESFAHFTPRFHQALEGDTVQTEFRFRSKEGLLIWTQVVGTSVLLPDGDRGVIWSVIDVTSLHEARQEVRHQAMHDTLTGLPNRRSLEHHLSRSISRARRNGTSFAVGMFDLDDFKSINDSAGHEAGDRVLKELSGRLSARLREHDLLARLGGDEFIVVIEDIESQTAEQQLSLILERFYQALLIPFEIVPGNQAYLGLSMGVSLFPQDAEDGDSLLRLADASMYQSKMEKHDRLRWWRLGTARSAYQAPETPFDPYGHEAVALLQRSRHHIDAVILQFTEAFYAQVSVEPELQAILNNLTEEELQNIASNQASHLRFLVDPATTRPVILERARHVGQVHALVGLGISLLVGLMALYRKLLSEHLNRTLLTARDRYRLLLATEARLQDDLQAELKSVSLTTDGYLGTLSSPLPQQGTLWADARRQGIEALGNLPGIQCVLLMRLDSEGRFLVEDSAGSRGSEAAAFMRTPALEALSDPDSPKGQGLLGRSWRSLRIHTSPSYIRDPRFGPWIAMAKQLGVRSALTIPVRNETGHPVALLALYGAYPNQFESISMQLFARGLEQRWEQVWMLCQAQGTALREDQAEDCRRELFSGGLAMYMQPVVDLVTGKPVKVEALARLKRADGQIVSPGVFLPILGDAELDRLFLMGLDEALSWLNRWETEGLLIDISLNLPPGTLLDPNCLRWVETALSRHNVAPHRLTLELLENREIEHVDQDRAIHNLLNLGVKLAMDDLGAGYSSLQRLSLLPFDNIKVDQGLLRRIRIAPVQTLSMIGTLVRMGVDFERDVVIEGLEDSGMIEAAALLGAPYGQGFALARPMPAEKLTSWSKTFTLPIESGRITTLLGALAFHWKFMHREMATGHPPEFSECPLTRFFEEQGLHRSEGAAWHQELHRHNKDIASTSRKLMAWLDEQVRGETGMV